MWQDFRVIIAPCILWCSVAGSVLCSYLLLPLLNDPPVTGIHTVWSVAQPLTNSSTVFVSDAHWILSFYVMTLCTNAVATGEWASEAFFTRLTPCAALLAFKIWKLNSMVAPYRNRSQSLIPIAMVLLECGLLYTCSVLIIIITYALQSNSLYLMLNIVSSLTMIMPESH